MRKPFYPGIVGEWSGQTPAVTNDFDPNYVDQMWDLK